MIVLQELESHVASMHPDVQQLTSDVLAVKQLVARSRPGAVRSHPDVQRLEKEVDQTTSRWENLSLQIAERWDMLFVCDFYFVDFLRWDHT